MVGRLKRESNACSTWRVGWDALPLVDAVDERPLIERRAVVRDGFYETQARTVIERVPRSAGIAQRWAVSPYRGCAHACRGCGARGGHRRLGLDAGVDFDTRVVVKANVVERLGVELGRWGGEALAVGVSGDCYQEAERTYRLMPGVVAALAGAGVECRVLMAPVLPLLSDGADQLAATVRRIAAAGAVAVEPVVLRLPAGTRAWFVEWLGRARPELVARYEELYDRAGLPSPGYEQRIIGQIGQLCRRYGVRVGPVVAEPREPRFPQLTLV